MLRQASAHSIIHISCRDHGVFLAILDANISCVDCSLMPLVETPSNTIIVQVGPRYDFHSYEAVIPFVFEVSGECGPFPETLPTIIMLASLQLFSCLDLFAWSEDALHEVVDHEVHHAELDVRVPKVIRRSGTKILWTHFGSHGRTLISTRTSVGEILTGLGKSCCRYKYKCVQVCKFASVVSYVQFHRAVDCFRKAHH